MTATTTWVERMCAANIRKQAILKPFAMPRIPPEERPVCRARPECAGCNMPGHGFVCSFRDGSCLKYPAAKGGPPDAVCVETTTGGSQGD